MERLCIDMHSLCVDDYKHIKTHVIILKHACDPPQVTLTLSFLFNFFRKCLEQFNLNDVTINERMNLAYQVLLNLIHFFLLHTRHMFTIT